jgi:uncharacterized protein YaaW (UPF0174 family)
MEEPSDERITNFRNIVKEYSDNDKQYIADKLSDLINIHYSNVDFELSFRDLSTNTILKLYLKDEVYKNILNIISDLKEYRALEAVLYKNKMNKLSTPPSTDNQSLFKIVDNKSFNASFNSGFSNQLSKNKLEKMINEEKKLASLIDNSNDNNEIINNSKMKPFHTLTILEVVDNLSISIVTLFQQIYTLDYIGLLNSQEYFIYYGFILILSHIILSMFWNQLNDA